MDGGSRPPPRWRLHAIADRTVCELADLCQDLLEGLTLARVLADDGEGPAAQRLLDGSIDRVRRRHRDIADRLDRLLAQPRAGDHDVSEHGVDVVSGDRGR